MSHTEEFAHRNVDGYAAEVILTYVKPSCSTACSMPELPEGIIVLSRFPGYAPLLIGSSAT